MGISVLDLFKIGVGPSNSHTMAPMKVCALYVQELRDRALFQQPDTGWALRLPKRHRPRPRNSWCQLGSPNGL